MTIQLKRAIENDFGELAELMNSAYGGTGEVAGWTHVKEFLTGDRTSVAAIRAELKASPRAEFLIVREAGELRGSVWLEPKSSMLWYLGSLTVSAGAQNSGLGRRILEAAEQRMAQSGGRRVIIDVLNVRVELLAWYERRGYTLTGVSHPFPYEDGRYGVPQQPDLVFLELEKNLS